MQWAHDFVVCERKSFSVIFLKEGPQTCISFRASPNLDPPWNLSPLGPQALLGQEQVLGSPCLLMEAF